MKIISLFLILLFLIGFDCLANPSFKDTLKINSLLKDAEKQLSQNSDSTIELANQAIIISQNISWEIGIANATLIIGQAYTNSGNYYQAKNYLNEAVLKCEKLFLSKNRKVQRDALLWKSFGLSYLGIVNQMQSNYPKALAYFNQALRLKSNLKNKKEIAFELRNIGNNYYIQGNIVKAMTIYLDALKIDEEINDLSGIAGDLVNIANINTETKDYVKAKLNYLKTLAITKKLGDVIGMSISIGNLGLIYFQELKYDSALVYLNESYRLANSVGYADAELSALISIGNICLETKDYVNANLKLLEAIKIARRLKNISQEIQCLGLIGKLNVRTKNYVAAELNLNNALILSDSIGSLRGIQMSSELLSVLYEQLNNKEKAFFHFKKFISIRDSLNKQDNQKTLTQSQMNYDFEKKEILDKANQAKKEAVANEEKQKEKIIKYAVSLGLIGMLFFAFFVYRNLKQTKKANGIISQQKIEVESQKHLIEEKHREITDSINYAERIQRSFLATKELLNENLKEHFVFFKPKDVVSGDFYWATNVVGSGGPDSNRDEKFILVTADSTGHGVPGAIMSILNISSLEKAIAQGFTQPSEIFNSTRKTIIERLKKDGSKDGGKDGMDASLISFNFMENKINYVAANNPIWIVRDNNLIELAADKMPVGKHDRDYIEFTQHEFILHKGDSIYTLTDGMPDQFGGPKGKKFMYKKLKELLVNISTKSMDNQKQILNEAFENWKGMNEQVDDVCLIGVKV